MKLVHSVEVPGDARPNDYDNVGRVEVREDLGRRRGAGMGSSMGREAAWAARGRRQEAIRGGRPPSAVAAGSAGSCTIPNEVSCDKEDRHDRWALIW